MNNKASKKSLLQKIPWWLFLLLAVLSYCTLRYLLPALAPAETAGRNIFNMAPQAAPIIAAAFLLLAANALYKDDPPKDLDKDVDSDQEDTSAQ